MANRRTNGKAKAGKGSAAKKQQATSNDKATKFNGNDMVTKVNGKAKVGKSISTKKSPAKSNDIMAKALQTLEANQYVVDNGTKVNNVFEAALARKWKNYFNVLPLEVSLPAKWFHHAIMSFLLTTPR